MSAACTRCDPRLRAAAGSARAGAVPVRTAAAAGARARGQWPIERAHGVGQRQGLRVLQQRHQLGAGQHHRREGHLDRPRRRQRGQPLDHQWRHRLQRQFLRAQHLAQRPLHRLRDPGQQPRSRRGHQRLPDRAQGPPDRRAGAGQRQRGGRARLGLGFRPGARRLDLGRRALRGVPFRCRQPGRRATCRAWRRPSSRICRPAPSKWPRSTRRAIHLVGHHRAQRPVDQRRRPLRGRFPALPATSWRASVRARSRSTCATSPPTPPRSRAAARPAPRPTASPTSARSRPMAASSASAPSPPTSPAAPSPAGSTCTIASPWRPAACRCRCSTR